MFENIKKERGDWNLFPGKILSNIQISDCKDTIDGTCEKGLDLERCIEKCSGSGMCDAGYFISLGGDQTVCAPLRTDQHPDLNPTYRLIDSESYPELEDANVTTFVNQKQYPFPPGQINTLHYRDIMSLVNVETGDTFGDKSLVVEKGSPAGFGQTVDLNLTVYPKVETLNHESNMMPVVYGKPVDIALPSSAYSLHAGGDEIIWGENLYNFKSIFFRIKPHPCTGKKIGDPVDYDEPFLLTYNDIFMVYEEDGRMLLTSSWKIPEHSTFKFLSKMKGYYCDDGNCSQVAVEDIEKDGGSGTYKGQLVSRKKDCWGACEHTNSVYFTIKSSAVPTALVILLLTLALGFVVYIIFMSRGAR